MKKRRKSAAAESVVTGYDYSTREAREETVSALFARARSARSAVEQEWTRYNDYYNFIHAVSGEVEEFRDAEGMPVNAVMPDPWIIVESQIEPDIPEPEFRGRDSDMDSKRAKEREYAVRYICENNRIADMNTRNERRLLKYGDAFWKAYWDTEMRCGANEGDVRIRDLPVESVFPDPSVRDGTIQDGQYIDYVYRVHKVRFVQMFGRELKEMGIDPEEILSRDYVGKDGIFDMSTAVSETDDTVQILEHWFKQPVEVDGIPAGSVACSIQAGGRELRYIPDYWQRTHMQCKLFPFVHYWRGQDENQIWNKSELFPVLDLVDAADRKLAVGLMNDEMMGNDMFVVEEGAISGGGEITNEPGAVIEVKPNRINSVRRLGGMQSLANAAVGVNIIKDEIERASRTYESSRGGETSRATTATALAMIREDAGSQADIKRADRNRGFERLYELLDWLALEFFDDGRMIFLGADKERGREQIVFPYNSDEMSMEMPAVFDQITGEQVREAWKYWPKVDVTITASDSVIRGKQATLAALQSLAAANVTAENWRIYAAQLELLDIPGKQDIVREWETRFTVPVEQGNMSPGGAGVMQPATDAAAGLPSELMGVPTGL